MGQDIISDLLSFLFIIRFVIRGRNSKKRFLHKDWEMSTEEENECCFYIS